MPSCWSWLYLPCHLFGLVMFLSKNPSTILALLPPQNGGVPGTPPRFFAMLILSGGFGLCDLGGNAPEDHGCGLLNSFQALSQQVGVSVPNLDVISGGSTCLKTDGLADHEGYGFGLGLTDLLGGQGAALAPVSHLVADLVRQSREFLGGLHPGK